MTYPRRFKGIWIPAKMWADTSLTLAQRIILAEIESLDNPPHHCYAGNEHFMELFGLSERTVTGAIAELKRRGDVVQVKFDGRTRILASRASHYYDNDADEAAPESQILRPRMASNATQRGKRRDSHPYMQGSPSIHKGSDARKALSDPEPSQSLSYDQIPDSVVDEAVRAIRGRGVPLRRLGTKAARELIVTEARRLLGEREAAP